MGRCACTARVRCPGLKRPPRGGFLVPLNSEVVVLAVCQAVLQHHIARMLAGRQALSQRHVLPMLQHPCTNALPFFPFTHLHCQAMVRLEPFFHYFPFSFFFSLFFFSSFSCEFDDTTVTTPRTTSPGSPPLPYS